MDIATILSRKYRGELWLMNGDNYEKLVWLSESEKPSLKMLQDAWPEVEMELENETHLIINARHAAIAHAKSLGFTDDMIAVMYPDLTV